RGALAAPATEEASAGVPRAVWDAFVALTPAAVSDVEVAADWKVVVEQWLETPLAHQHFVAPNQLLEIRADGAAILQVLPTALGHCRLRCFEFSAAAGANGRTARDGTRPRSGWLKQQVALAESTQAGLVGTAEEPPESGPVTAALAQFRARVAAVLHALPQPPGGR